MTILKRATLLLTAVSLTAACSLTAYAQIPDIGSAFAPPTFTALSKQSSLGSPAHPLITADDEYSPYQWALYNNGSFQETTLVPRFEYLITPNFQIGRAPNGDIYSGKDLPTGPGAYDHAVTQAATGIDINIQPAWAQYDAANDQEKRDVIVAVIDTGVDFSHPDLLNSIWVNEDEIPSDGIDNDGNGYVDDVYGWNFFDDNNQVFTGTDDSHGTHAAGTIAAGRDTTGIAGIADNHHVKVMIIKALGTDNGIGTSQHIIDAINYAKANGASICNLSLGTRTYYENLYQTMKDSNMLFVVASGNGDRLGKGYSIDDFPMYPASFDLDNIISVSNILFDGSLDVSSNYGLTSVDIAAPGDYILSTVPDASYGYMSGTSMAAPMVTGVAAMLYSYRTDIELNQVKEIMMSTVKKLDKLQGQVTSGGIPDSYAAMNWNRP